MPHADHAVDGGAHGRVIEVPACDGERRRGLPDASARKLDVRFGHVERGGGGYCHAFRLVHLLRGDDLVLGEIPDANMVSLCKRLTRSRLGGLRVRYRQGVRGNGQLVLLDLDGSSEILAIQLAQGLTLRDDVAFLSEDALYRSRRLRGHNREADRFERALYLCLARKRHLAKELHTYGCSGLVRHIGLAATACRKRHREGQPYRHQRERRSHRSV